MPKLQDFRKTKKVNLPGVPDAEVEIYDSVLAGDLELGPKDESSVAQGLRLLPKFIKSWNFTGDDDKPLEITADNVKKLKSDDVSFLLNEIEKFGKENQKKE